MKQFLIPAISLVPMLFAVIFPNRLSAFYMPAAASLPQAGVPGESCSAGGFSGGRLNHPLPTGPPKLSRYQLGGILSVVLLADDEQCAKMGTSSISIAKCSAVCSLFAHS